MGNTNAWRKRIPDTGFLQKACFGDNAALKQISKKGIPPEHFSNQVERMRIPYDTADAAIMLQLNEQPMVEKRISGGRVERVYIGDAAERIVLFFRFWREARTRLGDTMTKLWLEMPHPKLGQDPRRCFATIDSIQKVIAALPEKFS